MTPEIIQINSRVSRIDGRLHCYGKPLPDGVWQSEHDHIVFEHAGLPCILARGGAIAWCGYVAVPPGHPWHGKSYGDVRVLDADGAETWPDVHGGLTYSEKCQGHICHVAKPGESDDVWWLGFDCNHSGDLAAYDIIDGERDHHRYPWPTTYKTVDYVRAETMKLADLAKAVNP